MRDQGSLRAEARVAVHPHCHARADGATASDLELLRRIGFDPFLVDGGCCGLAGSFGYSADHEALSRRIGEEQWLPRLRVAASDAEHLVIDGFSCVLQREHLAADLPATTLLALVRARVCGGDRTDGRAEAL